MGHGSNEQLRSHSVGHGRICHGVAWQLSGGGSALRHRLGEVGEKLVGQFLGRMGDQALPEAGPACPRSAPRHCKLNSVPPSFSANATVAPPHGEAHNTALAFAGDPCRMAAVGGSRSLSVTLPLKRADTGPTFILAVARKPLSSVFSVPRSRGCRLSAPPDRSTLLTRPRAAPQAGPRRSLSLP